MKKHADQKKQPGAYSPIYCPLELYSSDPERVKKALYALWDDWMGSNGTINMLRIFVNGKVLDPSEVCAVSLPNLNSLVDPYVSSRNPQQRSLPQNSTPTTHSPLTRSPPICEPSSWKP